MVQLSLAPVVNEKLFSKHFLEERIKGLSEWQEDERAKIAYEKIKKIYEGKKEVIVTYTDNEAQLEMDFIRPVLKALGHIFGVQATVQQSAKRPDYAFFDNEGDKTEAFKNKDSDDFYKNAIAVGDAKAWDKDLDKKVGGKDIFENQNPSYQIDFYLRETPPDWGVLTNGGKWRLYFEEVSHRLDTYYEVDLVDILEKDNFESFKYFYLFFRKEAFIPVGDSFLDSIYNQSVRFAEEIGESLEDNVYRALLWMAKGYFNMKTNQLEKNEENVKKVHENSLIFLYRLLFLLYSESKGMLGTEVPRKYANQYSFTKWVDDILNDIDNGNVNPRGGLYNFRLMSIFRLVREGSEALGIPKEEFYVPAYNGGLFDNEKHPLLRAKKIQDGHLARVVDLLVRTPSKEQEGRGKIDYSDLSLRHLGGIYEGLLEYKPKLANQDMVAVKTKGALKWIPASEAEKDFSEFDEDKRAEQGELYLATDRGERKATGSYYTPDYVVKYIVENAVGPVVEERLKDAKTEEEKTDAILSLKVLDPAMGSGHFLVETVDFLASKLAKVAKGEEKKRDIDWAKRQVARNCIYGVDLNSLATELAKVSLWLNTMAEDKPLSFLDHHLKTGNSLIGADIHKIDRHPKEVESVSDEKRKIGQLALSDFFGKSVRDDIKQLLSMYREMLEITEERPEDIKEQEAIFRKFEEHPFKKRFDILSDVQTSYYFGNKFSKKNYERLIEAFRSGADSEGWSEILKEELVRKASDSVPKELKLEENLSDQIRFFHWKLEFPEVFFNIKKGCEKENPGFDVVVGNPPYVRIQAREESGKDFISITYETPIGNYDIYVPFVERSIGLLNESGHFCFIMPNKFINVDYGKKLREITARNRLIERLINFGDNQIFVPQTTYTCLFFLSKAPHESFTYHEVQPLLEVGRELPHALSDIYNHPSVHNLSVASSELSSNPWHFFVGPTGSIFSRMSKMSLKLKDIIDRDFQGVATSGDPVYILEILREESDHQLKVFSRSLGVEIEVEDDSVKPLFKGSEIARYHVAHHQFCLLHPYRIGRDGPYLIPPVEYEHRWPKAWRYLKKNEQRLRKRERGKMDHDEWYAYVYPKNLDQFERPKIMTQVLSKEPAFCFDSEGGYFFVGGGTAGGHGMTIKESCGLSPLYVLCLLNSRLLDAYFDKISTRFRGGYRAYTKGFTGQLPIPCISFTTPKEKRKKIVEDLKQKYQDRRFDAALKIAGECLPRNKRGNLIIEKEKSDVVHDFLAFLAEQMIEMNKQKQNEIQGFLNWLEGYCKVKLDTLASRTKLLEYFKHDWSGIKDTLVRNKKKIEFDITRREPLEKIEVEYNSSIEKLKPLLDRIKETDALIDRIVYKLYGLTDEEIKIVEESFQ